jgi:hypothetical protein
MMGSKMEVRGRREGGEREGCGKYALSKRKVRGK